MKHFRGFGEHSSTRNSSEKAPTIFYNGETAEEERYYQKFRRFLHTMVLAGLAIYPVRNEVGIMLERAPRLARAAWRDGQSEQRAAEILQEFNTNIQEGKPLDVSLSTLYLEQEMLSGGATEEEYQHAQARFEAIIGFAQSLQQEGKGRDEVMGYILKQQGKYDASSSLLTDLLNTNRGECEARQRFISAAFQRLYPEDVARGAMKTEVFRPWIDKQGTMHPGHVRVVVTRDDGRIDVLEGDAVKTESQELHKEITAQETTTLAVVSFAKNEGISVDDDANTELHPPLPKTWQHIRNNRRPLLAAQQALQETLRENSVSTYPVGSTHYAQDGVGTRNVDPNPIGNTWAPSRYSWGDAIEITFVKQYPELTDEMLPRITQDPSGYLDLRPYTISDPSMMQKLWDIYLTRYKVLTTKNQKGLYSSRLPAANNNSFRIRANQNLPMNNINAPGSYTITHPAQTFPEFLERVRVHQLKLHDVTRVPENIGSINFLRDGFLLLTTNGSGNIDPAGHLSKLSDRLSYGDIRIHKGLEHSGPQGKQIKRTPVLEAQSFSNLVVRNLDISRIDVRSFGTLYAEDVTYRGGALFEGQFAHTTIQMLDINAPNATLEYNPFVDGNSNALTKKSHHSNEEGRSMRITARRYGSDTFAHAQLSTLICEIPDSLPRDVFKDAQIQRLVFDSGYSPESLFMQYINALTWPTSETPIIGAGITTVVFRLPQETNLAGEDQKVRVLNHITTAKRAGYIHPDVEVLLVSEPHYTELKAAYNDKEQLIPLETLREIQLH